MGRGRRFLNIERDDESVIKRQETEGIVVTNTETKKDEQTDRDEYRIQRWDN